MGAFLTNYHVRISDKAACIQALKSIIRSRAMVTEPANGWITIYDETSESQNLEELRRVGKTISSRLKTAVFCFMVHDSDIFVYLVYEKGKLVDQFDSRPDYFGPVTDQHRQEWAGNFDKLVKFAESDTKADRIAKALKESQIVEEERAVQFATFFGIDQQRAREGFKYAKEAKHNYDIVLGRGYLAGDSELIEAVAKRDLTAARKLLDGGTSPNLTDQFGFSLLVGAIRSGATEIADALIDAGADVLLQGKQPGDALWIASAEGQLKMLEKLLSKARGDDRLPKSLDVALRAGVLGGHVDLIPLLLAAGADINSRDESGQTPLMFAAIRGLEGTWEMQTKKEYPQRPGRAKTDWRRMVETLWKAGANLNLQTKDGITALMAAAARGNFQICRLLVDSGADLTLKHTKGMTALGLAYAAGHQSITELLQSGAGGGSEIAEKK
jgi:ankyrin repeat protein